MKIQYFLIGMLIASGFIVGTTTFWGDISSTTGTQINGSFNTTFDKTNEMLQVGNLTNSEFTTTPISTATINPLQFSSWSILQVSYDAFSIVHSIITNMTNGLELPAWIGTLLLSLITFGLIFAIMAAIFYGRQV